MKPVLSDARGRERAKLATQRDDVDDGGTARVALHARVGDAELPFLALARDEDVAGGSHHPRGGPHAVEGLSTARDGPPLHQTRGVEVIGTACVEAAVGR